MKTTLFEKIVYAFGVLVVIALSPVLLALAIIKTVFTFLMGGIRAVKDE